MQISSYSRPVCMCLSVCVWDWEKGVRCVITWWVGGGGWHYWGEMVGWVVGGGVGCRWGQGENLVVIWTGRCTWLCLYCEDQSFLSSDCIILNSMTLSALNASLRIQLGQFELEGGRASFMSVPNGFWNTRISFPLARSSWNRALNSPCSIFSASLHFFTGNGNGGRAAE